MDKLAIKPLAIIILNWNRYEYTANCIISILRHCNQSIFDIILIDNHSTDSSFAKLTSQFPQLTFHRNEGNLGYAGGNNPGLQTSLSKGYKYTMILNNDTEVTGNFISPLINFMDTHPAAGAVQPKILMLFDPSLIWNAGSYYSPFLGRTYTRGYAKKNLPKYNSITKVDWITGCCMMLRNEVFSKTGLLNEAFFLYYEDTDISFRIKKAGYDLYYVPDSFILHAAGISGKSRKKSAEGYLNPMVHYYNARNKFWFIRQHSKWYYDLSIIIFQSGVILAYLSYFVMRWRLKKAGQYLKGIKDGLCSSDYKKNNLPYH